MSLVNTGKAAATSGIRLVLDDKLNIIRVFVMEVVV